MKIAEELISWYEVDCPYCANTNWFSNGNEQDLSDVDVEVIKCYDCGEEFALSDLVDENQHYRVENGRGNPR